jgi:hypothetical protein
MTETGVRSQHPDASRVAGLSCYIQV